MSDIFRTCLPISFLLSIGKNFLWSILKTYSSLPTSYHWLDFLSFLFACFLLDGFQSSSPVCLSIGAYPFYHPFGWLTWIFPLLKRSLPCMLLLFHQILHFSPFELHVASSSPICSLPRFLLLPPTTHILVLLHLPPTWGIASATFAFKFFFLTTIYLPCLLLPTPTFHCFPPTHFFVVYSPTPQGNFIFGGGTDSFHLLLGRSAFKKAFYLQVQIIFFPAPICIHHLGSINMCCGSEKYIGHQKHMNSLKVSNMQNVTHDVLYIHSLVQHAYWQYTFNII